MQKVQLYIEGQRVDFFEDEKISVTQSIQDLKDPDKIFTDFSKTFNIPASKTNNKIFKHFYNFNIVGGFDARKKVLSEIKINFVRFKKGYIKLEKVKLKNNAPDSYDITFFGETVILKDTIGEKKLSNLTWLYNFNNPYSSAEIKSRLQNAKDFVVEGVTYDDAVLIPLITHTNRLFYDSTSGHEIDDLNTGNLHYDTGTGHHHGVLWSDLKYSIRLHIIILAIQKQYSNIIFSDDFFNISNPEYYNLYMWMHRKKGDVQSSLSGKEVFTKLVDKFETTPIMDIGGSSGYIVSINYDEYLTGNINFSNPSSTDPYNVIIKVDGETVNTFTGFSGSASTGTFFMNESGIYTVTLESSSTNDITFAAGDIDFTIAKDTDQQTITTTDSITIASIFEFEPVQQIPDIKIIDFLKGLFNMFNLTAYVNDEGIIVVDTLDNFYANFNEYDITQYVDINQSDVDNSLPYKQIDFTYADYKTYLAALFNQLNTREFGELKYAGENPDNWVGDIYKIKLPFQKMLYERLSDQLDDSQTTIQYGWMADDNKDPYLGKPLIHYVHRKTGAGTTTISFRDTLTTQSPLATYFIPLNSNGITGTEQSLNFKVEFDEYASDANGQIENLETLFKNYYFNYISDVFKSDKRLTKLKAELPLKILLNYKLNDRFIVDGNVYKINSIKTDLQTGKSNLELINE